MRFYASLYNFIYRKMIFSKLKEDVKAKVRLKNPVFPDDVSWKQSHYVLMSEIINDELQNSELLQGQRGFELGKTISSITLKRFFEGKYNSSTVTDLRFQKSVDKLAIFLGFENFGSYHAKNLTNAELNTPVESDEFFTDMVRNYCAAEFKAYQSLPNFDFSFITEILFKECPLRARFTVFMELCKKKNFAMIQEGHRSNYELYEVKVLNKTDTECICETTEFWKLLFKSLNTDEHYTHHYRSTQSYFFKKEDDEWKLWDNYNPNTTKLNKLFDYSDL